MSYTGKMCPGAGIATKVHSLRMGGVEEITGPLHPGTLNVSLDRRFDWEVEHEELQVPGAANWRDLEGDWVEDTARLYPVTVGGVAAWAMRLDRSRAPRSLLEIIAPVRLRDVLPSTFTVGHR